MNPATFGEDGTRSPSCLLLVGFGHALHDRPWTIFFSLTDLHRFTDSSTIGLSNLAHHDLDDRSESLHLLLHSATLYTIPEARTVANVACAASLPRKQFRQPLRKVKRMCDRVHCCAERLGRVVAVGQSVYEGSERCSLGAVLWCCRSDEEEDGSCVDGKL